MTFLDIGTNRWVLRPGAYSLSVTYTTAPLPEDEALPPGRFRGKITTPPVEIYVGE